ncbi:LysR family transcriptional regulator [Komagataeibacter sp. FXV3]|uniref:LysR family transcriptional regulator n=1 Tax=Komagataeibacter sp. FXV3 TaxID=2608998 RepID=UPI00187B5468|nr:LysR family transcriptional regulator [Komagataeibacter sp. FXV3]
MSKFSGSLADIDIRLLRVFVSVAEHGGVSAAASTANVDRSTISRQLTELETRLGLCLCSRGRSGFWLSEDGHAVLSSTYDLLNSLRDFERRLHQLHDPLRGKLAISIPEGALSHPRFHLPRVIGRLSRAAPFAEISVYVESAEQIERSILNQKSHIGITTTLGHRDGLVYHTLFSETNRLYAGSDHPIWHQRTDIATDTIANHIVATMVYDCGMSLQIQRLKLQRGPMSNSIEGIATFILSNTVMGFLPAHFAQGFVERGLMRPIELQSTDYEISINCVYRETEKDIGITKMMLELMEI